MRHRDARLMDVHIDGVALACQFPGGAFMSIMLDFKRCVTL